MKIENGLYVVFEYTMSVENGERIGGTEPDKPFGFIVGRQHMLPSVEKRLIGMDAGEKATFWLLPNEAFGDSDPANIKEVPKGVFPDEAKLEVGMLFQAPGGASPYPFTVKAINGDQVVVDMNHPLAGKKLRLDVVIHDVRPLTHLEEDDIRSGNQSQIPGLGPPVKA